MVCSKLKALTFSGKFSLRVTSGWKLWSLGSCPEKVQNNVAKQIGAFIAVISCAKVG